MKQTLLLLIIVATMVSCGVKSSKTTTRDIDPNVTQVLYFHTEKRCITCKAIEQLTQEVVDSLGRKDVVMRIVNIKDDEGLADHYEVAWSSLILDRGGHVDDLTDMAFSYAKSQPMEFKAKLVEALDLIAQ